MITILISTIKNNIGLLKSMNIQGSSVVINQLSSMDKKEIITDETGTNCTWIDSTDRGLSKSRNLAIENSKSYISVVADDDLVYVKNYEEIIEKAYKENPNYDIIAFKVEADGFDFKSYPSKKKNIGYLRSMKISSVQITFKTESVKNKVCFNESFGSGSTYLMGEENIFLFDCLRKGLKILFIPETIAFLKESDSTWFSGFNEKYLIDRGASFYAMTKVWYHLLIIQFAVRKASKFKKKNISFITCLRLMYIGKNDYKKLISKRMF